MATPKRKKRTGLRPGKREGVVGDEAAQWAQQIGECWRKSVAGIIQTGRLLREAHPLYGGAKRLNYGEWGYMFTDAVPDPLPFGQDYAAILMRIAENPILVDSDNCRKLPSAVSALYALARLPDDILKAAIQEGVITPKTTAAKAKGLALLPDEIVKAMIQGDCAGAKAFLSGKAAATEQEPEWWEERDLFNRASAFATKELRLCPKGRERIVGHILRAVAHYILTPLPPDVRDKLYSDYQELTHDYHALEHANFLDDRRLLISRIRAEGGMEPTKDYEGLPLAVYRGEKRTKKQAGGFGLVHDANDGKRRGFDEFAQMFADEHGMSPRDVERRMEHTLRTANPRRIRKATRSAIKSIDAILDDRALKTGLVPAYCIPGRGFSCVGSYDEVVQMFAKELGPSSADDDLWSPGRIGVFVEISHPLDAEVAAEMRREAVAPDCRHPRHSRLGTSAPIRANSLIPGAAVGRAPAMEKASRDPAEGKGVLG
jgi:hypothetical protein